ncbi:MULTISPECIES: glycosyltransferase [Nostocales]|uniref:Glycosyltransferase family 2 protein n=4 Tax=Nostocales TaxID=1161 RepID=A0A8S9T4J3_9CYAN|nr:glycosyltransferase [Tolypothrix bouteillei]KAF3886897.1 glycosyltransferase family 2 protein [Tolypothrix bouteillei VB521301]
MKPLLSVIICTHNPRRDYLDMVLQALKEQSLSTEFWELLLVDNASEKRLSSEIDLTWHPQSRHIREEKLGLTPARLKGIEEAVAETLVFVDDDNVLDSDYLEVTLQISKDWKFLGSWGGQIRPQFDEPPAEWTKPYWQWLAIREFDKDIWLNIIEANVYPCGAGMCVRKVVAEKYVSLVLHNSKRSNLDRKGNLLFGCGDMDLAFTACDIGLGMGLFVALKLIHLIPAKRLQEDYLVKLAEGNSYSTLILNSFRGKIPIQPKKSWKGKFYEFYRFWRMSLRERRFYWAHKRGETLAIQEILNKQITHN